MSDWYSDWYSPQQESVYSSLEYEPDVTTLRSIEMFDDRSVHASSELPTEVGPFPTPPVSIQ